MYDVIDFLHDGLGLFALTSLGGDGLVDGERDGAHVDGLVVTVEDVEGAVDGEGDDGDANLIGEHEGAALEGGHPASVGAGAFGEDDHGHASLEGFARLLYGLGDAGDAVGEVDLLGLGAGIADEGDLAQVFLHHPLEVVAEVAIDEEDVVVALVVGEEDIALFFLDVLAPLHFHLQQEEPEGALGPELGQVVGHVVGVAEETGNDDGGGHDDGYHHKDGQGDEEGVEGVEKFHVSIFFVMLSH